MSIQFSDTVNNTGIVQQARVLARVDATQWPTARIVNSCNNWGDFVAGYAIGADKRFQWDDTNHTKLPIGTTDLTVNQSDYSFLTDEQGNAIVTLTRIDIKNSDGLWEKLDVFNQSDTNMALDEVYTGTGNPLYYDKIADNIIRLYPTPATTVSAGLKFYFQRTPSRFTATDTTKAPGVSPLLHRGYVIASAYDIAMTLGLPNLSVLSVELEKERQKVIQYFGTRNNDERKIMSGKSFNFR